MMERRSAPPPRHPELFEIGFDVAVRLKGHGQYKGRLGAIEALARRAPGFAEGEYQAVLDLFCLVYDRAVEAIRAHRAQRPEKTRRFAEFEDIDIDSCMVKLEAIEPGVATDQKRGILNWVIYWHHLK